jgi:hypothetical protein
MRRLNYGKYDKLITAKGKIGTRSGQDGNLGFDDGHGN